MVNFKTSWNLFNVQISTQKDNHKFKKDVVATN